MIVLDNFNIYFGVVVNALFTGIGVALGSYIANSHVIKNITKLKKKIKKNIKRKK